MRRDSMDQRVNGSPRCGMWLPRLLSAGGGEVRFLQRIPAARFHACTALAFQAHQTVGVVVGLGLIASRGAALLVALSELGAGGAAREQQAENQHEGGTTDGGVHAHSAFIVPRRLDSNLSLYDVILALNNRFNLPDC